ncbi:TonB-dependent copper receptor [Microbulbifer guangxiensis]|uniref:TonB-dependent copper receptor n=1 Tax=Microbulbifer guangxiensis TaxID=2904249 RepID=UPI001F007177|nr:TonB-dependent copper receptor [Microbulbifer guangxiensis]
MMKDLNSWRGLTARYSNNSYAPVITHSLLGLAIAASMNQAAIAAHSDSELEQVVVTGAVTQSPLNVVTDPRQPRQPLPANDGADYLKTIPGFSVIRKGGTDGDPVLRGMAGSRLSVLVDGEVILGGCNNRMDPPTAYIFPESMDVIQVIKGPQTVKHGPGNSAGVVLFEREQERPGREQWEFYSSLLAASAGRSDGLFDARYSSPGFSVRGSLSAASADDYRDGDGVTVHSRYERWQGQTSLAWTPDEDTRLALSASRSDGEAAYADRGVDGSRFAREHYSASGRWDNLGDTLQSIEVQGYFNYVDHVMDNYNLREPGGPMGNPVAMNPDRETRGGIAELTLTPSAATELVLGVDTQFNAHTSRNTMNQQMVDYRQLSRSADAEFLQSGLYSELSWNQNDAHRWIGGARLDHWQVEDQRSMVMLSMMASAPNPSRGLERDEVLKSGFLRHEVELTSGGSTLFAGVGHSERFPDYWEMIARETADSVSAFDVEAEKTTQLDIGWLYNGHRLSGSISAFYNAIDDYLLIQSGYEKPAMAGGNMMGMPMAMTRSTSIVRNIDARTWGLELDAQYRLHDHWQTEFTLASVRGANETDTTTLAQLPPLEARLALRYSSDTWSAGLLVRGIASQKRVDVGKGNIAGQDIGPTNGARVLSLNGSWQASRKLQLTAGVDNLLDETYAEHISRAGVSVAGFTQLQRVNEPGRTLWMNGIYRF